MKKMTARGSVRPRFGTLLRFMKIAREAQQNDLRSLV